MQHCAEVTSLVILTCIAAAMVVFSNGCGEAETREGSRVISAEEEGKEFSSVLELLGEDRYADGRYNHSHFRIRAERRKKAGDKSKPDPLAGLEAEFTVTSVQVQYDLVPFEGPLACRNGVNWEYTCDTDRPAIKLTGDWGSQHWKVYNYDTTTDCQALCDGEFAARRGGPFKVVSNFTRVRRRAPSKAAKGVCIVRSRGGWFIKEAAHKSDLDVPEEKRTYLGISSGGMDFDYRPSFRDRMTFVIANLDGMKIEWTDVRYVPETKRLRASLRLVDGDGDVFYLAGAGSVTATALRAGERTAAVELKPVFDPFTNRPRGFFEARVEPGRVQLKAVLTHPGTKKSYPWLADLDPSIEARASELASKDRTPTTVTVTRDVDLAHLPARIAADRNPYRNYKPRRDNNGTLLETRAAWVQQVKSHEQADTLIAAAERAHLNCLIVHVGSTQPAYRSNVQKPAGFVEKENDPFGYLVEEAHKRGIQVQSWFCISYVGAAAQKMKGYNVVRKDGSAWRSFSDLHRPEARSLIADIMMDHARTYPIDAIHLDYVRIGKPQLCYCDACKADYRKMFGRDLVADAAAFIRPTTFHKFQEDALNRFVALLAKRVRSELPGMLITAAIGVTDPRRREVSMQGQASWEWLDKGWLDVLIPMVYMKTGLEIHGKVEAHKRLVREPARIIPSVGLYDKNRDGRGRPRDPELVVRLAEFERQTWNPTGIVFFDLNTTIRDPENGNKILDALASGPFREKALPLWPRPQKTRETYP